VVEEEDARPVASFRLRPATLPSCFPSQSFDYQHPLPGVDASAVFTIQLDISRQVDERINIIQVQHVAMMTVTSPHLNQAK
jgi:hypothetical protein